MCTSPIRATAPWRTAAESIRTRTACSSVDLSNSAATLATSAVAIAPSHQRRPRIRNANIDTRMPQPDRESVCGRRIVDGIPGQPRPSGHPRPMMIHQGMTRISTAGQWVQATSATVPVRSRDMTFFEWPLWSRILNVRYFRLAGNGPIVRSKPAIRRTRQQSALSGTRSRREQRVCQRVQHRPRLAVVGPSGVFPPKLPTVSVRTLWDAFGHEVRT